MPILAFALLLSISLSSCFEKDGRSRSEINASLQDGLWSISYFMEDGVDETADFADVLLRFEDNGRVVALKGSQEFEGSWTVRRDDGDLELDMNFNEQNALIYELDDDWYFSSMDGNTMHFMDDSRYDDDCDYDDEDDDEEYLILTKIDRPN